MRISHLKYTVVGTLLFLFIICFYTIFFSANILVGNSDKTITICYGNNLSTLREKLRVGNYIKNILYFDLSARVLRFGPKILPGHYKLKGNMSNFDAIRMLRRGQQKPVKIILHDINSKEQLVDQLTKNIGAPPVELYALLNDRSFLAQYGFTIDNVMAMFIPNTYEVYWTTTPKRLFETMYGYYKKFWHQERVAQAHHLKMTPIEVSILATIVQKESNKKSEIPIIAGVYINRLRKGIRLSSCATLLYVIGNKHIKRVLKKDLWADSPYNTYRRKGLPPGPIAVPTIAAIDAVLNYTHHNYLYFSAREDFSGYHYFTDTYHVHIRNSKKYQHMLNRNKILR